MFFQSFPFIVQVPHGHDLKWSWCWDSELLAHGLSLLSCDFNFSVDDPPNTLVSLYVDVFISSLLLHTSIIHIDGHSLHFIINVDDSSLAQAVERASPGSFFLILLAHLHITQYMNHFSFTNHVSASLHSQSQAYKSHTLYSLHT